MWKNIRIACLLLILVIVAVNAWRDYHQDWTKPIVVLLHPINADGSAQTTQYIQQLSNADFAQAQQYLQRAGQHYFGAPIQFKLQLGRGLTQAPPTVPEPASIWSIMLWSLKFRFYAWRQHQSEDGAASVTLFLSFYDPHVKEVLKNSTALQNGRIGSIHLFSSHQQDDQNTVILVHELLHAFGAKDKYDLATGQPLYPVGYAHPFQQPRYPQTQAEIMAGHMAITANQSAMPENLTQTLMGATTAQELGWKK